MKKFIILITYFLVLLNSINIFSQSSTNLFAVDSNGTTYEIDPVACTSTQLNKCNSSSPFSIAMIGSSIILLDHVNY